MTQVRSHHARGVHTIAPMGLRRLGQHKTYYTAIPRNEPCPICGQVMRKHQRCAACRALVGRGHAAERVDGDGKCEACVSRQELVSAEGAKRVREAVRENVKWE